MLIGTQAVFAPTNTAALKAAVGTCTWDGVCTGGCLAETADGSCPIFAASNDATGNPYGVIGDWDTSQVTDMKAMFYGAIAFNQPLTHWVTSKVTDMSNMFQDATSFNQPLAFDTSKVMDMREMFWRASSFNQPLTFNTSQVTNMGSMFQDATSFNQPLPFDTEQVTTMEWMFRGAIAFNQPLSWGAVACPAGKLRVSDGADCTVPVELTCAQLKAEYQSSSRDCGC